MYTLTFPSGRSIHFHLKGCAEIFQQCYGGKITELAAGTSVETY